MPWNTLLTNASYYENVRLTGLKAAATIFPYFAIIFMSVKFIFVVFSSFLVHVFSPERQIIVSGLGNTIIFACFTLMSLDTKESAILSDECYFGLILFLCFLASICCAFLNNALYTILGRYDPKHTQAISNGQGLAGMIPLVVKIALIYSLRSVSITYMESCLTFAVSTIIMLGCIVLFILFHGDDHSAHYYISETQQDPISVEFSENEKELSHSTENFRSLLRSYVRIFSQSVFWYAITVMTVFIVTLALFPVFYIKVASVYFDPQAPLPLSEAAFYYNNVFMFINFLLFNLGDWIGKVIPLNPRLVIKERHFLALCSFLRFIYFPIFLLSHVTGFGKNYPLPTPFSSDAAFYIIAITFGVTSGYLSTVAMMTGPTAVPDAKDRPKAATVMVFFLTVGLTLGVYLALILSETFRYVSA